MFDDEGPAAAAAEEPPSAPPPPPAPNAEAAARSLLSSLASGTRYRLSALFPSLGRRSTLVSTLTCGISRQTIAARAARQPATYLEGLAANCTSRQ